MKILITGASKGIGRATAILFARKGWTVGATDIDKNGLDQLEKEQGGTISFFSVMDVTDPDDVSGVLEKFCGSDGKLDALFNNAGVLTIDPFEKTQLKAHHLNLDVNSKGVLNCTYLAFPYLKNAGQSWVINMSSLVAEYGVPSEASYSASKFYVRGLTEALNIEWERYGIHVCDIMPTFVNTPMMQNSSGKIVQNVGISLTDRDIAMTALRAVNDRKKIHWRVDSLINRAGMKLLFNAPYRITRFGMKIISGFTE